MFQRIGFDNGVVRQSDASKVTYIDVTVRASTSDGGEKLNLVCREDDARFFAGFPYGGFKWRFIHLEATTHQIERIRSVPVIGGSPEQQIIAGGVGDSQLYRQLRWTVGYWVLVWVHVYLLYLKDYHRIITYRLIFFK